MLGSLYQRGMLGYVILKISNFMVMGEEVIIVMFFRLITRL